jgi:hypothetical protein
MRNFVDHPAVIRTEEGNDAPVRRGAVFEA